MHCCIDVILTVHLRYVPDVFLEAGLQVSAGLTHI